MYAFHRITLEDREQLKKIYAEDGWEGCEYTFGNNILWGKKYYIEVAYIRDCCLIRYDLNYDSSTGSREGAPNWMYSYPMGKGDKKEIIDWLIRDSQEKHYPLFMNSVSEKARQDLITWYPNRFFLQENRNYEDYIYRRDRLATLSGKKLHKKRTHIHHFQELGSWSYENIDTSNIQDCLRLCKEWAEENADRWDEDMAEELHIAETALQLREELHLIGGLLRVEGKPAAFCIGEDHGGQMVVVHFEKALTRYPGSYQMINQQFALHLDENILYVNREDDTGNPGLRKAKLSYYPDLLLKKYNALYSDVIFADPTQNREDILHIWKTVFGDTDSFIGEFINRLTKEDTILLCCADGKPVSMACFLPVTITGSITAEASDAMSLSSLDARYVYAVATLPEYRGRGYAAKVLAFALEHLNLPLVLSPAEESLYDYYAKQGFRTLFTEKSKEFLIERSWEIQSDNPPSIDAKNTETTSANPLPSGKIITDLNPAEYKKLRDAHFSQPGYFAWDLSMLDFIYYYHKDESFRCVSISASGNASCQKHFLMYNVSGETLQIRESSYSEEELQAFLPSILPSLEGCTAVNKAALQFPGLMLKSTEAADTQLAFWDDCKEACGYFNFNLG